MPFRLLCGAAALPLMLSAPAAWAEQAKSDALTDIIVVTGQRQSPADVAVVDPVDGHATAPDAAALVAKLPGAALISNGALSGQVQFRGLFSDRLAIRVGGQFFQTGGPNAMDPPLHYAPAILLESISLSRGAAPVSTGPGLGALVEARLKSVDFGDTDQLVPTASLAASYRSADDGRAVGGVAGLAGTRVKLNLITSWEAGNDYRTPGGRAAATAYERLTYGISAGLQAGGSRLTLDLRRQETGPSGNPPYAMDIDYFDTNFARLAFDGSLASHALKVELAYAGVRHGMDNFSQRPAPATTAQYRYSYAEADSLTGMASLALGALTLGIDGMASQRLVTITNPANATFFVASLDRVKQERISGFAEAKLGVMGWQADFGLRIDRHSASMANPRIGPGVPPMMANLANATAAANAPRSNTTWDAVVRLWREDGAVRPRLILSRKSRAPNAVERFSWLPTEASGGLADGNIYIGRQTLKPEVAWAAEVGVDVVSGPLRLRPSVFYRRIDGYIQGSPVPNSMIMQIAIATLNGDATPLIASNVDAEFYGADADLAWQIARQLRLDGTISYVRGQRRDIADNLYRIAPLNGRLALTWEAEGWSVSAEAVGASAQNRVSATNGEVPSPGWVSANLWFTAELAKGLTLSGGIENLLNRRYSDHLAGRNRVALSEVALGERLPAPGRSAFIRLGLDF